MRRQGLLLSFVGWSVDYEYECVCDADSHANTDTAAHQYAHANTDSHTDANADAYNDAAPDQYPTTDGDAESNQYIAPDQYHPSECVADPHQSADRCGSMRKKLCYRCRLPAWLCLYDCICHHSCMPQPSMRPGSGMSVRRYQRLIFLCNTYPWTGFGGHSKPAAYCRKLCG